MHLDLMKKKMEALETHNTHRVRRGSLAIIEISGSRQGNGGILQAEQDWEEVVDKNRKLSRQLEKVSKQLNEARQTIQFLKKDTADSHGLKVVFSRSNCDCCPATSTTPSSLASVAWDLSSCASSFQNISKRRFVFHFCSHLFSSWTSFRLLISSSDRPRQ